MKVTRYGEHVQIDLSSNEAAVVAFILDRATPAEILKARGYFVTQLAWLIDADILVHTNHGDVMIDKEKLELQSAEFDAVMELTLAYRNLPPVVDDAYPEMRHYYERSVRKVIAAFAANGRLRAPESIVRDWASCLGLRHQGVLMSAVRGCDSVQREDASKYLVRVYRGVLLNAHCGDLKKASSFMVPFDEEDWSNSRADFLRSIDHYPNHWLLHFMRACEIVGYKHPPGIIRDAFRNLYLKLVSKFHLEPESETALDKRLNADEATFKKSQIEQVL